MKTARVKSDLQVRAALRASQERRLTHATLTIHELIRLHSINEKESEHDSNELYRLHNRLLLAIRNQHVKDRAIASARQAWIEQGGY